VGQIGCVWPAAGGAGVAWERGPSLACEAGRGAVGFAEFLERVNRERGPLASEGAWRDRREPDVAELSGSGGAASGGRTAEGATGGVGVAGRTLEARDARPVPPPSAGPPAVGTHALLWVRPRGSIIDVTV
jgi:hypothetical protein